VAGLAENSLSRFVDAHRPSLSRFVDAHRPSLSTET
jgi:hypothetical protein